MKKREEGKKKTCRKADPRSPYDFCPSLLQPLNEIARKKSSPLKASMNFG